MKDRALESALLLAIFGSVWCSQPASQQYGTAKIGEPCERDRNCIRHAYCRTQKTCWCDQYYSPSLDNSMCIASAGLGCQDDLDCDTMANASCRQGVCACKDSYILDINNSSNCVSRPLVIGDRCQRTDECHEAFDRARCIDGRCQCVPWHHFASIPSKCVQSRLLYYACTEDYECTSINNENVLVCRNHECVCKEGEPTCSKGSALAIVGTLAAILPILLRFI